MPLQDLPNELLYHIADFLEYADDASAFSRSCRLFYSLVNDTLVARYAKGHELEAIEHALETGDHVLMENLIDEGVDPLIWEKNKRKKLIYKAAGAGHTELVRLLLDREINDVHGHYVYQEVPLIRALLCGHWETARLLISYGADPDYIDVDHYWCRTALDTMADKGSLEGVRFLVENTASTLKAPGRHGRAPLASAAYSGHLNIVKYLFYAGADHRTRDAAGLSALFHAAARNHEDIVLFILEKEEEPDFFKEQLDLDSLACIASRGNGQITRSLLDRVNIPAKIASSSYQLGPLMLACAAVGCDSSVQLLLDAGCDPTHKWSSAAEAFLSDNTPLRQAAARGHGSIVRRFLDRRCIRAKYWSEHDTIIANLIQTLCSNNQVQLLRDILDCEQLLGSSSRRDVVSRALYNLKPHEEAIRLLLEQGATADYDKNNNLWMLQRAVELGSPESVRLLLEITGINPREQLQKPRRDQDGQSLYELAIAPGRPPNEDTSKETKVEMVRALLETNNDQGGSVHPANQECQIALVKAISAGQVEIVKYFLDSGFDANGRISGGDRGSLHLGRTLLGVAAGGYHRRVKEMTELFLAYGADVEATDGETGATALVHAVKMDNRDAVDILLNHGADPLYRINNSEASETPLHQALVSQRSNCLRILLKAVEARGLQWDISAALCEVRQYKDRPDPMDRRLLGTMLARTNNYAGAIFDSPTTGRTRPECKQLVKYLVQHYCRVKYPCPL
ncbi:uncharacterized protein LDX57_000479 [Aspergillus melleus]|uniref:uncharacterized protein n=1 Tax=Aspergillus melleus TaxID=138277 RepID=UPI001E8D75C8|nr:uncharacterized protein LDX57_000479 [Aspergillus melleus]KAH8422724.1 hypothetical protein LDX57_000479 [Aspergillus melleus]